jgi:lambda family phage tail tape measure protein
MATLGSVVVEMSASTAKFESDLGRAAQMAERQMAQIDRAVAMVKSGLQTLGLAVSVGLAVNQVKNQIERAIQLAGDLDDLADKTGGTVETLSTLASVARLSGTDMDALSSALQRLSRAVVDAQNGGKQTAGAFKALGLSIEQLRGLGPDEVFLRLAEQLNQYRDGVEKTTIAQVLMGRSGANLLTVVKDLGVAGEFQLRVTAQQAQAADELQKNMVRLQLVSQSVFQSVANQLVPVFNDLLSTLLKLESAPNGVRQSMQTLAADNSIRNWAQQAVLFLATVAEAVVGVARVISALSASVAVVIADSVVAVEFGKKLWDEVKTLGQGSSQDLRAALDKRALVLKEANERYAALLKDGTVLTTALREQFMQSNQATPTKPPVPKALPPVPNVSSLGNENRFRDDPFKKILDGQIKALEDAIVAESKLLKSREQMLDYVYGLEYITLREAETRKQALLADNLATVRAAYDEEIRLAQEAMARRGATQVQMAEASNRAEEAMRKRTAAEIETNQAITDSQLKLLAVQARFDLATRERARLADLDNANALFAIGLLGKTTLEVLKLTAARQIELDLQERIRQLRKQDPQADTSEAMANAAIQTANASSLIELAYNRQREAIFGASEAVRKYQEEANDAATQVESAMNRAFQGMEDALVEFVTTGKLSFTELANSIVADITRIIIKQQLAAALGGDGGMGWLGSILGMAAGSLFGTAGTAAVASTMGGDALENMLTLTGGFGTIPGLASGGPVSANGLYQVNEQGPELLRVSSGREYLLMDDQNGQVIPYADQPPTVNVINNFTFNSPTDRRTQAQIATQAGLSVQRALARNT